VQSGVRDAEPARRRSPATGSAVQQQAAQSLAVVVLADQPADMLAAGAAAARGDRLSSTKAWSASGRETVLVVTRGRMAGLATFGTTCGPSCGPADRLSAPIAM
jgi:hypothetical protein